MASFTEVATLRVIDQSSAQLSKINSELKKLQATARSLKSQRIDLSVKDTGVSKAVADMHRLAQAAQQLKGVGAINLRANTGGIAQAQRGIAALHTQARRPITLGRIIAGVAGGTLATRAATAAGHSVKQGTEKADIGQTTLAQRQLPKWRSDLVDDAVTKVEQDMKGLPGGQVIQRGILERMMSENLAVTREGFWATRKFDWDLDPKGKQRATEVKDWQRQEGAKNAITAAAFLTKQNAELAYQLYLSGNSIEDSTASATKFSKALESRDVLTDKTGAFNIKQATDEYNLIRQLIPTIGEEATGKWYQQMTKYLKTSRFGMSPQGMATTAFLGEEAGTAAPVGLHRFIQQLTGVSSTAQSKLALEKLGLVKTAMVNKQRVVTKTFNEDVLRDNPLEYVQQFFIPAMLKARKDITPDDFNTDEGKARISGFFNKVFSNSNAASMGTEMTVRNKELLQQWVDMVSRSGELEKVREATQTSVRGAMLGLNQSIEGAFGQAITAGAPYIAPFVNTLTAGIQEFGTKAAEAIKTGDISKLDFDWDAVGKGGILGAGAAWAGYKIGKKLLDFTAGPLGTLSALGAIAEPSTRPLGFAAAALMKAASDLSGAASALTKTTGITPIPPGTGAQQTPPGGSGGKPTVPPPPFKMPWWMRFGAGAGLTAGALLASTVPAGGKSKLPDLEKLNAANQKLALAAARLAQAEFERTEHQKKLTEPKTPEERAGAESAIGQLDSTIGQLRTMVEAANAEITRLNAPEPKGPDWTEIGRALKPIEGAWPDSKPFPKAPPPPAKWPGAVTPPKWLGEFQAATGKVQPPSATTQAMQTTAPGVGAAIGGAAAASFTTLATAGLGAPLTSATAALTASASSFATTSSSFASVFASGSSAIAAAGQSAVDTMMGGAGGIGAAIGSAFVSAANGVTANINVSVNHTGSGKDNVGTQAP